MTDAYTPRPDSLAAQVVAFFARNADESLTLTDITDKFDCARGNVHTQLSKALESHLLARATNDDGEYIYKAGPKPKRPPLEDSYTTADSQPHKATVRRMFVDRPKKAKALTDYVDPGTLKVCDDPLPVGRAAAECKYDAFLSTMHIGQAIKCQPHEIGRVSNALRKFLKTNYPVGVVVRSTKDYGDGFGRVWWIAGSARPANDATATHQKAA